MTKEELDEIDGALWGLMYFEDSIECETTVYSFKDKVTPKNEDIGYHRYNIFTYKPTEPESTVEFMKAYIGDVQTFIDNYAKAGYNGLMVKEGCIPKKTIKEMIRITCKNFKISNDCLKPILAQV